MAEFEKVIGTITVNKNILQVDNQFAGNMFSSDLTYNVNFTDDFWNGFEILEWYAASSVVGETVVCKYDSANKKLKIPYGAYIKNGPLYISMRGIKDSVKYSTNILVLVVGENINIEENDIVNDPSWLDKVQSIIDEIFITKYDPQYEALVQEVNDATQRANEISETLENKLVGGEFTPEFTIGNVETVEPSVPAEVTQTGTQLDPILNFKIPRGATNVVNDLSGYSEAEAPSQKAVHEAFDTKIVNTFDSENKDSASPTIKAIIENMTPQDNLLTNSDFRSGIINQKGQTTYNPVSVWTLSIDGWIYNGQMQVFVQDGKIRLYSNSSNTGTAYFQQTVSNLKNGKHLLYVHVESLSGIAQISIAYGADIPLQVGDNFINADVTNGALQVRFLLNGKGVDLVIDEMKLEKGKYFTGMKEWNEADELLKCYRKYISFYGEPVRRIGFVGSNELIITYELPVKMNGIPTLDIPKKIAYRIHGTNDYIEKPITGASIIAIAGNAITVSIKGVYGYTSWNSCYVENMGIAFDSNSY